MVRQLLPIVVYNANTIFNWFNDPSVTKIGQITYIMLVERIVLVKRLEHPVHVSRIIH